MVSLDWVRNILFWSLEWLCHQPLFLVSSQDVQYSDIDYMERQLDFTLSPKFSGLPDLINRMKADGMRVILILVSPCVNVLPVNGTMDGWGCTGITLYSMSTNIFSSEITHEKCTYCVYRKLIIQKEAEILSQKFYFFSCFFLVLK